MLCHYSFGAFHHTHVGPRYTAQEDATNDAIVITTHKGSDGGSSSGEEGARAATAAAPQGGGLRTFAATALELGLSVHDHVKIVPAPPKRARKLARGRLQLELPVGRRPV